ncbi:MAG: hypothetical protein E7055_16405 [Lentisphaerae bacterium]|nr:hypothetical protein [Lentisphaerota bacterium]
MNSRSISDSRLIHHSGKLAFAFLLLLWLGLGSWFGQFTVIAFPSDAPNQEPLRESGFTRVRHDALFQTGRCPSSTALLKLRSQQSLGRTARRSYMPDSADAQAPIYQPLITRAGSNVRVPCSYPFFQLIHLNTCPVRAGPRQLS